MSRDSVKASFRRGWLLYGGARFSLLAEGGDVLESVVGISARLPTDICTSIAAVGLKDSGDGGRRVAVPESLLSTGKFIRRFAFLRAWPVTSQTWLSMSGLDLR